MAGIEEARGDLDAALAKYEESLGIARLLAEELGTPESRRDVSVSLDKVAGIEEARGDLDAALAKYEESLGIVRLLAEELGTRFSRIVCTAIEAWSVPGRQSTFLPRRRWKRTIVSIRAVLKAWPICRLPVTFGGGITTEKGSPGAAGSG